MVKVAAFVGHRDGGGKYASKWTKLHAADAMLSGFVTRDGEELYAAGWRTNDLSEFFDSLEDHMADSSYSIEDLVGLEIAVVDGVGNQYERLILDEEADEIYDRNGYG